MLLDPQDDFLDGQGVAATAVTRGVRGLRDVGLEGFDLGD